MSQQEKGEWFDKPIDDDLLEELTENGPLRIRDLRERERLEEYPTSYLIERLRELSLRGFCQRLSDNDRFGGETYKVTRFGEQYLNGDLEITEIRTKTGKIVDLSLFSAEDFKFRNTKFLTGDSTYDIREHENRQRTRDQIWVVRNKNLREALRRFPREKPLRCQCAYWVSGLTSKHFFPDANHRTSIALLRKLLTEHEINFTWPTDPETQERSRQAIRESKRIRKSSPRANRLDMLYARDRHYLTWWRYFVDVLEIKK